MRHLCPSFHAAARTMGAQQSTQNAECDITLSSQTTGDAHHSSPRVDVEANATTIIIDSAASISSNGSNGLTIALDDVGNSIKLADGRTKTILQHVSGVIRASDMVALMGQSGAGKTTLLDVLSRRKTEGNLMGNIYFDGVQPTVATIKKYTAYVPQIESFFGGATVWETIRFAAMIKLPGTDNEDVERKLEKVEHVIDQMNLNGCRNTLVGNAVIRGISGGELKRLSVACALLTHDPRAMFLDEPTSGLDSTMAAEVIKSLRRLQAEDGRTMVVTIHQPSMGVYQSFNKLILLNSGNLVYFGPGGRCPMEFFIAQGFPYEAGFNMAEYLIDTVSKSRTNSTSAHDFATYYAESSLCRDNLEEVAEIKSLKLPMNAVTINTESRSNGTNGKGKDSPYAHGPLTELGILIRYKDSPRWKYAIFWFTRIGLYTILASLLSSFFYSQKHTPSGMLNINGIAFISMILPCFMAQVHVEETKFEREVYTREFHDAYYRPGNYVLSKLIVELPMTVLASMSFAAILYWSVGLNPSVGSFFFFFLANFVNLNIAMLIGCAIAAAIPGDVGPAVILPIVGTLNMLVGGFFIRARTIHDVWKWLYNLSFIQWAWSAVMVNEYAGRLFYDHCGSETGGLDDLLEQLSLPESSVRLLRLFFSNQNECEPINGDSVLTTFDLEGRNKFTSLLYAALSIPVYFTIFYAGVKCIRHERR